jgi:hypothetical protein
MLSGAATDLPIRRRHDVFLLLIFSSGAPFLSIFNSLSTVRTIFHIVPPHEYLFDAFRHRSFRELI